MKENLDKRIERVAESVGSKKAAMRQWESDRIDTEMQCKIAAKRWRIYGISAAASVVVICGVGLGIVMNRGGGNDCGVTSNVPIYRGGSCEISEIQAMIDSVEYDKALHAIEVTMADTIIDPSFTKERQEYLRSLNANREYDLIWLKIGVLVKSKKTDEAISLLKEYVDAEGEHQKEAQELLNKLAR